MNYPIYQEIKYQHPQTIFANFSEQHGAVFLDSAQQMPGCGRYSFIGVDPFLTLMSKKTQIFLNEKKIIGDPFQVLSQQLSQFSFCTHDNMPPFQGGAIGFFSYDLYQHLEKIISAQLDDMDFPDIAIGFYDLVIAFDHEIERAWIFSSGFPESGKSDRAQERLDGLVRQLQNNKTEEILTGAQFVANIKSNFTPDKYCDAVQIVKDYILAGDIFEANISQRFHADLTQDIKPFSLYCDLRKKNPAPFSAYLVFDDTVLASASPERFLKLTGKHVETRPIKGTRPRGKTPAEDKRFADELLASEKDHAENVMIVDLQRNDLSRVCEDHSVQVSKLCGLESYASVHHLVSVVTGKLHPDLHAVDLLRATFPGGSITGAPKIRAMEIIAEIEPTKRGPYCGSIGYIGFNGDMDLSITIRTYAIKNNRVIFQTGGAVTMDSDPAEEYEETLTKSKALRDVLNDFINR